MLTLLILFLGITDVYSVCDHCFGNLGDHSSADCPFLQHVATNVTCLASGTGSLVMTGLLPIALIKFLTLPVLDLSLIHI